MCTLQGRLVWIIQWALNDITSALKREKWRDLTQKRRGCDRSRLRGGDAGLDVRMKLSQANSHQKL